MSGAALFGRYWPADSPLHRLDPRAKLVLCLASFVAVFSAATPWALLACAAFLAACYLLARIPPSQALRAVAPLLLLVAVTMLLNLLFVQGGEVYASLGPLQVSEEGARSAVRLGVRLLLLVLVASLLTLTTTTIELTEGGESLLGPLRRVGVPVHELAMMMALALRFLPQVASELQAVYRAQLSRGAHLPPRPSRKGAQACRALLVPLFANSLRHGETLSAAMEARCYHGAQGRTRLHPLRVARRDALACVAVGALLAGIILLDALG